MSDQSNLCTRCGADNLRDGYFCVNCRLVPTMTTIDDPWIDESGDVKARRLATVSRLVNLAPDDDGEMFFAACANDMAAAIARIESSGDVTW